MAASKTVMLFGSFAPSLVTFRGPLIASIVERGHRVIAVAPRIGEETRAALVALGAEPLDLPIVNQSLNPLAMIRAGAAVRRLIRARRPDILISYTIKPVIVGTIAASLERVPMIVALITGAGYALTGGREPKRLVSRIAAIQLYRHALRRAHRIIFQNCDDLALFRSLGMIDRDRNAECVNGSGIDLEQFAVEPLPEKPSFLMIARFLKDKGIREFAEASRRLKSEHPEVPITLVGYCDGSPDSIGDQEVGRIRDSGVDVPGAAADVRPFIAAASIYVLPSYREGTPRTVLEAMAMGRAIITSDAPGCRETVTDGVNGLLVPPRDADALYRAMERFVADPGLAGPMGAQSRKLAERKFDVRQVNADLLRIAGLEATQ